MAAEAADPSRSGADGAAGAGGVIGGGGGGGRGRGVCCPAVLPQLHWGCGDECREMCRPPSSPPSPSPSCCAAGLASRGERGPPAQLSGAGSPPTAEAGALRVPSLPFVVSVLGGGL